jgi:hypothetical protein
VVRQRLAHALITSKKTARSHRLLEGNSKRVIIIMTDLVRRAELSKGTKHKIHLPEYRRWRWGRSSSPRTFVTPEMRHTHEGLLAHPRVTLVDRPEVADYVIFCQNHFVEQNPFHRAFRQMKDRYKEKAIMLDYRDDPRTILDADDFRWRLYFKRSCVDRENGRVMSYGALAVIPTAYGVVNDMCDPPANQDDKRGLDVSCLFDDGVIDSLHFALARGRLLKFAKRLAAARRNLSMQIGPVSRCGAVGRASIDPKYKRCLYDSKIILHANPDAWEGDSRLWEALASGALVFVDRLLAPIKNPLIDGEHLIFYDLTDEGLETLEQKIVRYLADDGERQRIGMQGREFVMTHHRSIDRVSEIIGALECTSPEAVYSTTAASRLFAPETRQSRAQTAQSFSEARARAERWTSF